MSGLRRAIKYFHSPLRIKWLPRHLVTPFDIRKCDEDEVLLFMAGAAKDRHAVERLKAKYKVGTAAELLPLIPKRHGRSLRSKLMDWLRRLEGSTPYEHYRHEVQMTKREERRRRHNGYVLSPLKHHRRIQW